MRLLLRLSALALAVATSTVAPSRPAPAARTAQRDWSRIVVATPEGGFRMGNPQARVKLVEYASYTCPHCAHFAAEGVPVLKREYVGSGRVSWEFRPFLIFPTDPGISMLVHCRGSRAAFPLTEKIYAEQQQWVGRLRALPQSEGQRLMELPPAQRVAAFVKAAGIDRYFREQGMPQARIDACLADSKGLARIVQVTEGASKRYGVHGTPAFLINDKIVDDAADWARLLPALRAAVGR